MVWGNTPGERLSRTGGLLIPLPREKSRLNPNTKRKEKGWGDNPCMVQVKSQPLLIRERGSQNGGRNLMDRKVFRHNRQVGPFQRILFSERQLTS